MIFLYNISTIYANILAHLSVEVEANTNKEDVVYTTYQWTPSPLFE